MLVPLFFVVPMSESAFPTRLAVLGPGLLGGSIALAVRERYPDSRLALWGRRAEAVESIRQRDVAATVSTDLGSVVEGAELVVLCVPIGAMADLAKQIAPMLSPTALVTDVGSVKGPVVRELTAILGDRFVGSHPMAGSERDGFDAARANLFEGAVCVVTTGVGSDSTTALGRIEAFWAALGCSVRRTDADRHDEVVAAISHLPHVLAAALVDLVGGSDPQALEFCGPGFRDTTRVAGGPAAMWTEILRTNREPVRKSIEAMVEKLREVVILLDDSDGVAMNRFLNEAKMRRDSLRAEK